MDVFLMRHAKSAYPPGVADISRPLSPRGRRNAVVAAQWLARMKIETALLSPSQRTRETWEIVRDQVHATEHIIDDLYDASAAEITSVLASHAEGPTLVLGHNPGIQLCAIAMARGDEPPFRELTVKFPTCAIAHLRDGVLTDFIIPR